MSVLGSEGSLEAATGVALLERAVGYTLGSLLLVTPRLMHRPTPCSQWDLGRLLAHMNDSLAALQEAGDLGLVDADEVVLDLSVDPVQALKTRACRLVGAWVRETRPDVVSVSELPLTTAILARTGAIEVTVHGWDVAQACGRDRPIPGDLATELLAISHVLVTEEDRPAQFAPPLEPPAGASPSDRLLAYLGRESLFVSRRG